MTISIATDLERRRSPSRAIKSPYERLARICDRVVTSAGEIVWPSTKYQTDPAAFASDVLGMKLWSKQVEILEALAPKNSKVAVTAGQKAGKTATVAVAAWWFFCSFPNARVIMLSTTARQVDEILWRELRQRRMGALLPLEPSSRMPDLARTGFKSDDTREIFGFTAKQPEAVAGLSGEMLFLIDEASGVDDEIFEAIEGNCAGGGRVMMVSNPTKASGTFFEAFHGKKDFYKPFVINTEQTPNVLEGREVVKHMATREFIEEKRRAWGTTDDRGVFTPDPIYRVRILGEFVTNEEGRIIPLHLISQAEERWHTAKSEGTLHIGIDPAGPGQGGDESTFATRRGRKVLGVHGRRAMTTEDHLTETLRIVEEESRGPRDDLPIVKVDQEGPIGWAVYSCLKAHADASNPKFILVGVKSSARTKGKNSEIYDLLRDELWAVMAAFLVDNGAIPEDAKLARELYAPQWRQEATAGNRLKATPKHELRKILDRSPDRADAVALAVWTPLRFRDVVDTTTQTATLPAFTITAARGQEPNVSAGSMDPYAGASAWQGRR